MGYNVTPKQMQVAQSYISDAMTWCKTNEGQTYWEEAFKALGWHVTQSQQTDPSPGPSGKRSVMSKADVGNESPFRKPNSMEMLNEAAAVIMKMCAWSETREGIDFWSDVHDTLIRQGRNASRAGYSDNMATAESITTVPTIQTTGSRDRRLLLESSKAAKGADQLSERETVARLP